MSNLKAWRSGEEYLLPGGLEVRLRRATLLDLVAQGKIPQTLTGPTEELINNGQFKIARYQEFAPVLDLLARACIVYPPIGDVPDDDHLSVAELGQDDKMAIYEWASQEVAPLRKFRAAETEPVESVRDGAGIRPEAE
ncbi:hypothetical protein TFLX_03149 [Thermoflexales bacterium]|nr:hypothetical protein TFLX_03149 [Thermoflexales bacterium]